MAVKTLKSLVLKTASVSVKLPTPADRIGTGFPTDIDNPATFLSQGQFTPRLPEPEPQARSRREVADMRLMSMPSVGAPAGSVGRFSGTTVRWCPVLATASGDPGRASRVSYPGSKPHAVWHRTTTPAAAAAK
jgi:hypothetical protein